MILGIVFVLSLGLVSSDGSWFPEVNFLGLILLGWVALKANGNSNSAATEFEKKRNALRERLINVCL